jgi:hypothetical protein
MEAAVALTLDFAGIAACAVVRAETMQHGSEVQLDPVSAGCGGVCQDAPMSIAGSPAMFRIDPPLEGGQQSAEW